MLYKAALRAELTRRLGVSLDARSTRTGSPRSSASRRSSSRRGRNDAAKSNRWALASSPSRKPRGDGRFLRTSAPPASRSPPTAPAPRRSKPRPRPPSCGRDGPKKPRRGATRQRSWVPRLSAQPEPRAEALEHRDPFSRRRPPGGQGGDLDARPKRSRCSARSSPGRAPRGPRDASTRSPTRCSAIPRSPRSPRRFPRRRPSRFAAATGWRSSSATAATRYTTKGTLVREAFILEAARRVATAEVAIVAGRDARRRRFGGRRPRRRPGARRPRARLRRRADRLPRRSGRGGEVPRPRGGTARLGARPATARSASPPRRWRPACSPRKPGFERDARQVPPRPCARTTSATARRAKRRHLGRGGDGPHRRPGEAWSTRSSKRERSSSSSATRTSSARSARAGSSGPSSATTGARARDGAALRATPGRRPPRSACGPATRRSSPSTRPRERSSSGTRRRCSTGRSRSGDEARDEGSSVLVMAGDNETADELATALPSRPRRTRRGRTTDRPDRSGRGRGRRRDRHAQKRPTDQERSRLVRPQRRALRGHRPRRGRQPPSSDTPRPEVELEPSAALRREHVALGYALTIHKAQGSTTDRAVVLVDEADDPTPALRRDDEGTRGEPRPRRLCDRRPGPRDVDRDATARGAEAILRHEGEDRSAHDVLRASLAAYEDRSLLSKLVRRGTPLIDERAGPDRSAEIAALRPTRRRRSRRGAAPPRRGRRPAGRERAPQRHADLERVPRRPLRRRNSDRRTG